jgi:hypothetical protein
MRRTVAELVLIFAGTTAALAQAPIVRAKLEPPNGIKVGQTVRLVVEVLVPNYFTGTPDFPEFEIDNAIVVLPQERAQNTNAQVNGKTYAGIIETYSIYPEQPGDFQIPAVQLAVPYAGDPPKTSIAHVSLPALRFHAGLPAEARGLDYFLPTTQLTMKQKWSMPLTNLQAGDTIERTITVTANKIQAMLIPPIAMSAPDGIRVYPAEPVVRDQKTDRGDFVFGLRAQSAKYFIQRAGGYTFPPVELKWWNLSTKRMITTVLPAVHFAAVANPEPITELPPTPEQTPVPERTSWPSWVRYKFWIERIFPFTIAILVVSWIAWGYLPHLHGRLREWRQRRASAEHTRFRKVMRACRKNDALQSYDALLRWLGHRHPSSTVDGIIQQSTDVQLAVEIDRLGGTLFSSSDHTIDWKGKPLAHCLRKFRKEHEQVKKKQSRVPRLNP